MLIMDTTAMVVMVMFFPDTATLISDMVIPTITTARGQLNPNPITDTTDIPMDTTDILITTTLLPTLLSK